MVATTIILNIKLPMFIIEYSDQIILYNGYGLSGISWLSIIFYVLTESYNLYLLVKLASTASIMKKTPMAEKMDGLRIQ